MDVPDEQWQFYFEVGIMSVVRCTRAAVPLMRKAGWGRVINISSISARVGQTFEAPYMTAKAGLSALSKNMAWALAKENILVNTVTPGVFQTEALRTFMETTGATSTYSPDNLAEIWDWMRNVNGHRPAGAIARVALPQELAPLLLLLGSGANSYIVGANIPVDGWYRLLSPAKARAASQSEENPWRPADAGEVERNDVDAAICRSPAKIWL